MICCNTVYGIRKKSYRNPKRNENKKKLNNQRNVEFGFFRELSDIRESFFSLPKIDSTSLFYVTFRNLDSLFAALFNTSRRFFAPRYDKRIFFLYFTEIKKMLNNLRLQFLKIFCFFFQKRHKILPNEVTTLFIEAF